MSETEYVLVPKDDPSRSFSDSLLPEGVIWAGVGALERAEHDLANYVPGETIDWDQGMIVVAVYRAMIAASPAPAARWGDRHTAVMNSIAGDLVRQFPEAFFEEDHTVVLDTEGKRFLNVDVSALAEAALPDAPVPANQEGEVEG